jgi:hypothetical protein
MGRDGAARYAAQHGGRAQRQDLGAGGYDDKNARSRAWRSTTPRRTDGRPAPRCRKPSAARPR